MGLQTELEKLQGLIESAKEKPQQRAEEEIERQKRDFEASRDRKIRELKERQEKSIRSVPIMATIGVVAIVILFILGIAEENNSLGITILTFIIASPFMVILAILAGVAGGLVGGLMSLVERSVCEVSIESLKKQTWEPPQSNPKNLLPP